MRPITVRQCSTFFAVSYSAFKHSVSSLLTVFNHIFFLNFVDQSQHRDIFVLPVQQMEIILRGQ